MSSLGSLDYIVLGCCLLASTGVGVYHALRGGKQKTANEYLLANRSMGPIPVALSVVVSYLSAITYLGTPAETYLNGPQFWVACISKFIPMYVITRSFCPIFYNLKITSIYEYLEMRFSATVRYAAVLFSFLHMMLYLGIVVYGPALALNAVTGFSLSGSILTVGLVCTFYTTIGGIKAVIWADVFQSFIMVSGFLVTIIACSVNVGGFGEILKRNAEGDRNTYFDMRINPTIRHTFWSVFFGISFLFLSMGGTSQIIVQRYLTCKSLKQAKAAASLGILLICVVEAIAILSGLAIYAFYAGCDPLSTGRISKGDQVMALIVVDIFEGVPGMSGFLISAVFSASLSTVSSGVNALATLTGEDIIKYFYKDMKDFKFTMIIKMFSVFYGLITIGLAFMVSKLGSILSLAVSIVGILNGPVLGIFCLGIYFPSSNSIGAIVGMIVSFLIAIWMKIGSLFYPPVNYVPPLYTDQCLAPISNTTADVTTYIQENYQFTTFANTFETEYSFSQSTDYPGIARLYAMSYLYYTPLTTILPFVIGAIVSFLTSQKDPNEVDPNLLSPVGKLFCCCFPSKYQNRLGREKETEKIKPFTYTPVSQRFNEENTAADGNEATVV